MSLGDTDEHAHAGNYPKYLRALEGADAFVGEVAAFGERVRSERDVIVLVTADHGRSHGFREHGRDYPESARTFLFAGGGPIRPRGYVSSPAPRHLADVAPTIAALARVDWAPSSPDAGAPLPDSSRRRAHPGIEARDGAASLRGGLGPRSGLRGRLWASSWPSSPRP